MTSSPHSIACEIVEGVTVPDYPELAALAADYLSVEARIINLQEQLAAETHLHVKYAAEAAAQKNRADGLNEQLEAARNELAQERSRPGGSFDQWADYQRLSEQLEAVRKALERISFHTFEVATRKRADDALARISNPARVEGSSSMREKPSSVSRPHSMSPDRRIKELRNLREGYDLVAAVGFWKELHDEDLIDEYASLVEQLEALQRECDGWRSQYQDIANQMIERGGGSVMEHARRAVEAGE